MSNIPIPGVPTTIRVPLFYASVDPSNANTLDTPRQAVLIGQITSAGSLTPPAPVSGATSAGSAEGSNILTFSSTPAGVAFGQVVADTTHAGAIPADTTVLAFTGTTVELSANVTSTAVSSGDAITFTTEFNPAPILATSQTQVDGLCGVGSLLSWEYYNWLQNNNVTTLYILPLQDASGAVAATGSITISGAPTGTGTVALYVDGQSVPVAVTNTMTAAEIASAIETAINALNLTVTASVTSAVVTVTANNAGLCGNDIDIRLNYYGPQNGESTPAGIIVNISPMSGGTTNPSANLTAALSLLPSQTYDFIGMPYSDTGCLNALQTYLNDSAGQWSPLVQLYGGGFTCARNTAGGLQTLGMARNDQHVSIMGMYGSPSAPYAWMAALLGEAAVSLSDDPATPCRDFPLIGILPPPQPDLFTIEINNTMLWSGISTFDVVGGQVYVQRLITTYQENAFDAPDDSMLSVETMYTLYFGLQALKEYVTSKYGRMKLADDGTRLPAGANITTPSLIQADMVNFYDSELVGNGWFQDTDAFAAGLQVVRNSTDPTRVDVLFDGIVMDQLNIFALLMQFRQSAVAA